MVARGLMVFGLVALSWASPQAAPLAGACLHMSSANTTNAALAVRQLEGFTRTQLRALTAASSTPGCPQYINVLVRLAPQAQHNRLTVTVVVAPHEVQGAEGVGSANARALTRILRSDEDATAEATRLIAAGLQPFLQPAGPSP